MTNDSFWEIIAKSKSASNGSRDSYVEALRRELLRLSADQIVEFQRIFDEQHDEAYRWDLWGAAFIIGQGCGDDSFIDFRSWLISMGESIFTRVMADPDSLAAVEIGSNPEEDAFFEEFAYVARQVYSETTGIEMPFTTRTHQTEPIGEPWNEDGDDLAQRFPHLWRKYGGTLD